MRSLAQAFKKQLRHQIKRRLVSLSEREYQSFNAAIREHFLAQPVVIAARQILIYYSINHEVETGSLITELLRLGKKVALPICTPERDLQAGLVADLTELVPGPFGLREPGPNAVLIDPESLDLAVLPGLAFDQRGHRLGYGVGYFDRFLVKVTRAYKLGLAYDFQLVSELPIEFQDIPVDGLITPRGFISFQQSQ